MNAYEAGKPGYFATPPVNLIYAYHASLTRITKAQPSLEERFALHRAASKRIKDAVTELGLKQVPTDPKYAANGMTAVYYPDGVGAADVVPRFGKRDVVIAGGLHAAIKGSILFYFNDDWTCVYRAFRQVLPDWTYGDHRRRQ